MFCFTQNCRLLVRSFSFSNFCTFLNNKQEMFSNKIKVFTKLLEFSKKAETKKYLEQHDYLIEMDLKQMSKSFTFLTNNGITVNDIRNVPKVLCSNVIDLRNRLEILSECGSSSVNCFWLNKFPELTNQSENELKVSGIIDREINLQQKLADILDVTLLPCRKNASLTNLRMHILQLFYSQNNFMSAEEFDDAIIEHPKLRHRSYRTTKEILKILVDRLQLTKEKVKFNFNLFQYDPQRILETLNQLNKLGITNEIIMNHPRILTLDAEFVVEQFKEINSRKELKAMDFHPLILKLVMNKSKAYDRLDALNQLHKKCFSLNILTGTKDDFKRFMDQQNDKNAPHDCVAFLAKRFNQKPEDVRKEISRHPFWYYIPFTDMAETIDRLLDAKFELNDIYSNIHVVLYSKELILKQLEKLKQTKLVDGQNMDDLPKSSQLKLVLYYIESEFKFTGNGVWEDRKSNIINFEDV